jgi:N6-L-threonylcarbamoyladenine synthase
MLILGIETSCDETAAAVVEDGTEILSNVVATSSGMHAKTGGIIPEQAARQQVKSIIAVIQKALADSLQSSDYSKSKKSVDARQLAVDRIDAIAVTVGPGLIGSLLVGVETAKTLSYLWKKNLVPINHLIAHIYANWLDAKNQETKNQSGQKKLDFPILALVVSGGHTDLVLMSGHGKIKWLGGTRDDAAGEAFDKCARLLGLPYPGGPSISNEAQKYLDSLPTTHRSPLNLFPRPMIDSDDLDFSFSGLKTSVLREVEKVEAKRLNRKIVQRHSAEIQEAIVDVLVKKSTLAINKYRPKSFLLAGGVSANLRLREKLLKSLELEKLNVAFHVPPPKLCTDNASYIASCAYFNFRPVDWKKITANPQLTIADVLQK